MGGKYVFLLQKNIKEKRMNLNHFWFFSLKKKGYGGDGKPPAYDRKKQHIIEGEQLLKH